MNYKLPDGINSGFTLVEVLIASFLTGLLILIAGYGLTVIINKNEQAEGESSRRIELNRAIEYMGEDIKSASSINLASAYSISPASCTQPILQLTISENGSPKTVVYYLKNISSGCGSSIWAEPALIKRVENPSSSSIPASEGSELVDAVSFVNVSPTPTCPTGWTVTPPSNQKGFYACLDNATNARAVELHLRGHVSDSPPKVETIKRLIFARSRS